MLVPRQSQAEYSLLSKGLCDCSSAQSQPNSIYSTVSDRIGQLLGGPQAFVRRLLSRHNSLESCADSSSTDSLQSNDSDECNDTIIIPEEFQVREFPASSLFSSSKSSNDRKVQVHKRRCAAHSTSCAAHSRHDRFYHVFKKGELERLIKSRTRDLQLIKCSYKSGHWCVTLCKTL